MWPLDCQLGLHVDRTIKAPREDKLPRRRSAGPQALSTPPNHACEELAHSPKKLGLAFALQLNRQLQRLDARRFLVVHDEGAVARELIHDLNDNHCRPLTVWIGGDDETMSDGTAASLRIADLLGKRSVGLNVVRDLRYETEGRCR